MKRQVLLAAMLFGFATASTPVSAALSSGKVQSIYADPADVVVLLDVAGQCGSKFFHIRRSAANFREMTKVVFTAFQTSKTLGLNVQGCQGDRNVVSHGYVTQ